MTIAGSDSGGGAGIQADLRTFALLGMHGLVAVTAVTVQNSVGVKGFHEIPLDVIAGQIEAVASDIGVQAAKTGMLASSAIIDTIADTWRGQGLAGTVPLVVDPVCASMHGDPLLHPSALDSLRDQLFPLATLVTPNLDEVRLLVDIEVIDSSSQREAARALHALGPQWALVKGGHLRSSSHSADLLFDGTDFYEFDATRIDTGNDHGAGDTLAAAVASALAHGYTVPDAVAFGKRWVTECLRAAYPLGHGHGPGVGVVQTGVMNLDQIAGVAHEPDGKAKGAVVLTHGAGGSRESPLLVKICDEWARRGWLAVRYNLPYRRRRPKGPPSGIRRDRSGRRRRGHRAGPHAEQGPGHRGRPFVWGPDDVDGGRRRGSRRRCADALLLPAASAGQARTGAHRSPAPHHGADGVHPRHRRSVRHDRRTAPRRGADPRPHRDRRGHRRPP